MTIKVHPIAHSYWRTIKAGGRTFESVMENRKDDVMLLAKTDVENSVITAEEYEAYVGVRYIK